MRKIFTFCVSLFIIALQLCADESTYLNFTAVNGPATVCLSFDDDTYRDTIELQYSTGNCVTWLDYTTDQDIQLPSGMTVYFKAKDFNGTINTHRSDYGGLGYRFKFGGMVAADGNIMSLLDASMTQTSVPRYAFSYLFKNCSTLVEAPALPATSLEYRCYSHMFDGCSSLTMAPALPATTLAEECYSYMFHDCTSLTQAPALPATTLAEECYSYMFHDCTSLTQAPALPATTLSVGCYKGMFWNCTSLTQAPALRATTLCERCYCGLFADCTSLTQAPALPAVSLAWQCYISMFSGCTSLTQAPALPAVNLDAECYTSMFEGCTSLTQAPALPATTLAGLCYNGMFEGCTSLTQAPALPAMTLTGWCYSRMFRGCTSLTQVPALPATILAKGCYWQMFDSCTSLVVNTQAPGKAWKIPERVVPEEGWNANMFRGTGGTFTGDPIMGVTYYIASDATTTGTENVNIAEYNVFSNNGHIFVNGAMGASVGVYDVNGQLIAMTKEADETHEFNVGVAGIYFVRINDNESVKVVVR